MIIAMRISTFFYTIKQGLKNIWKNKMFSLASIATMTACIFLFGLFYTIVTNFQSMVKDAESGVAVTVFFDEGISQDKIDEIGDLIRARAEVSDLDQQIEEAERKAAEEELKRQQEEAARQAAAEAAASSAANNTTTADNTPSSTGSSTTTTTPSNGGSSYDDSSSSDTSSSDDSSSSSSTGSATGSAIVSYATQFIGNPYVWGGTSLTNGADCSGFIMSVYAHFGYSLPHSSSALRSVGRGVSYAEAQPGDIICYSGHVAIYIGGGAIVHASNERDGIKISSNAAYTTILAVRRVV